MALAARPKLAGQCKCINKQIKLLSRRAANEPVQVCGSSGALSAANAVAAELIHFSNPIVGQQDKGALDYTSRTSGPRSLMVIWPSLTRPNVNAAAECMMGSRANPAPQSAARDSGACVCACDRKRPNLERILGAPSRPVGGAVYSPAGRFMFARHPQLEAGKQSAGKCQATREYPAKVSGASADRLAKPDRA